MTPKVHTENIEEPHNQQDDLPPQTDAAASKAMDIEANLANNRDLPSPIPSSTLVNPIEKIPSGKNNDDISIIAAGYSTPRLSLC